MRWGLLLLLAVSVVGVATTRAFAADGTAAISQGFEEEEETTPGALVSFADKTKSGAVRLANTKLADRLVGVVAHKPLVELSGGARAVQVVINGTAMVLVSDINGKVNYGDRIAPSPISGVGMKATTSGMVVGSAGQDFSAAQQVTEQQVRDRKGNLQKVKVGLIPVQVNVSYFRAPDEDQTFLPAFLQQFLNAVAGRPVGLIRALIALMLLIIGFGSAGILIYSSVRSSIISIGRNPLSAPAVHRSLFEVAGMGMGILLLMVLAVYLVLAT